jgi:serine/threonine-protein kinase HipA
MMILKVILWGKEVGRLAWDDKRKNSYFTYHPDFLKSGLDVSPLAASIRAPQSRMPIWGEEARLYQKLPAFLADSLPDAWGNQLFELWRHQNHLSAAEVTPLEKLSFIGRRGMGALEFEPEFNRPGSAKEVDMTALAALAARIYTEREQVHIRPEESTTLQSLLTVGTSAGGRQPKAILAIHPTTGEIRSGQVAGNEGFHHYLLKFGNPDYCSAELEMTYYLMALEAGIEMAPSRLYRVDGQTHFLTQRFDRQGEKKLHTQTLAALSPEAESYEQLIEVCRRLKLPQTDCDEVYRRMLFNHLCNNTDDHNKNFSFIMNEQGIWRLAPAYDVTYILNAGGYQPNHEHCLYVRAKLSDVTRQDVLEFAKDHGITQAERILRQVVEAAKHFRRIASGQGVSEVWIGRVESCIQQHLIDWNEATTPAELSLEMGGHQLTHIRIEQAYKGNFHLWAEVDGKARKFVFRPGTAEYRHIASTGIAHLNVEILKQVLEKFLKS